jgi:sugar/nucleoside kinase (ribokinase family)
MENLTAEYKGKVLTVGDITEDIIKIGKEKRELIGGTVYPGLTAAKLGYESTVLSRGNYKPERLHHLESSGVKFILQPGRNCAYVNDYTHGERRQFVLRATKKIKFDVDGKYDVIHVDPRFQEVTPEVVSKARERCKLLSMDVQGFVRDRTPDKSVFGREWKKREEVLKNVDVVKASKNEAPFVSTQPGYRGICEELYSHGNGPDLVAITIGRGGSVAYYGPRDEFYVVPAYKTNTVDETGCGDVFVMALTLRYFENKGQDIPDCVAFANAAASFCAEGFGTECIAGRSAVEERAEILKSKLL